MRVLVCGGRHFGYVPPGIAKWTPAYNRACEAANAQRAALSAFLDKLTPTPSIIIHGSQRGADELAAQWARRNLIEETGAKYRADFYPNGRRGGLDKSQGPKRNQRMLDEAAPDLVVAFPGGTGTADMVRRARHAGVTVIEAALEQDRASATPLRQRPGE